MNRLTDHWKQKISPMNRLTDHRHRIIGSSDHRNLCPPLLYRGCTVNVCSTSTPLCDVLMDSVEHVRRSAWDMSATMLNAGLGPPFNATASAAGNIPHPAVAAVNVVACELPSFWEPNPRVWVLQVEAAFHHSNVTRQVTKFDRSTALVSHQLYHRPGG